MLLKNDTVLSEFVLLGLSSQPKIQLALFIVFTLVYAVILIGNILIIVLVLTDVSLHSPMYFFLSNLSFLDLCYSTSTVPRMLKDLLSVKKIISYGECAAQMYISLSLGESECVLLAIMAYDRYVAICFPLHYTTIMNKMVCVRLAVGTWVCGFLLSISHVALTLKVDLCGHNEINHFLCEVPEILSLGCENIMLVESIIFIVGVIILMTPVTFIVISYINIIMSILKIASSSGQRKAFSTCGSHMMVVTIFYGSAMAAYMKPRSSSLPGTDKMIAIFYFIVTPMLNPLIYSLRNNDVKAAFQRLPYDPLVDSGPLVLDHLTTRRGTLPPRRGHRNQKLRLALTNPTSKKEGPFQAVLQPGQKNVKANGVQMNPILKQEIPIVPVQFRMADRHSPKSTHMFGPAHDQELVGALQSTMRASALPPRPWNDLGPDWNNTTKKLHNTRKVLLNDRDQLTQLYLAEIITASMDDQNKRARD
ncbi:putative olfactory receptor 2B8 [Leptodactylus fuscus]